MEQKFYFSRNELIEYVMNNVNNYNNRVETSHIAWDFLCDSKMFIDYMIHSQPGDGFYICIRKSGLESGDMERCQERCKILGAPMVVIQVTNLPYKHESKKEYQVTTVFNLE